MNNKLTELNRNLAQSVARDGVKPSGFLVVGLALVTFGLATTAQDASDIAPAKSPAIPWSQIGAKAGADYKGDGLSVAPTAEGARLRCVFQRLEGEATQEGLWLTSTVTNGLKDRFRIVAATVHRQSSSSSFSSSSSSTLQKTGIVSLEDQKVRFIRPGITEEYGVSMDGVRQDFLVRERPEGVRWLHALFGPIQIAATRIRPR